MSNACHGHTPRIASLCARSARVTGGRVWQHHRCRFHVQHAGSRSCALGAGRPARSAVAIAGGPGGTTPPCAAQSNPPHRKGSAPVCVCKLVVRQRRPWSVCAVHRTRGTKLRCANQASRSAASHQPPQDEKKNKTSEPIRASTSRASHTQPSPNHLPHTFEADLGACP